MDSRSFQFSLKGRGKAEIYSLLLLLHWITELNPAKGQSWDGIVVTQSNYDALQEFKQSLIDPRGFLRTWNDSGYRACSGGWVGIKCAKGEVIVIQLPWRGLSGRITEKISLLQGLRKLSLHDNLITGVIPYSLGYLPNLRGVQLFNNRLYGALPPSLASCPLLQTLDVSNNTITGSIPKTLAKSSRLLRLNLSFNQFTGPIPSSIGNLHNLTHFNVSYNNLTGVVPAVIARKFHSTSFIGNHHLCGFTAAQACFHYFPKQKEVGVGDGLSFKYKILIAAGAVMVTVLILACILLCCLAGRQKRPGGKEGEGENREIDAGGEGGGKLVHFSPSTPFTADDLLCATAEVMGKSTYGTVYKAILENGDVVAVKRLREKITKPQKEFEAEIAILGRIRHPNLVDLKAYYSGPKGEKLLVLDYMPKGSLAAFLHARGADVSIDASTRMNIARGVARALFHLHAQEHIIHGNLTSSNILLDENTNAKVSDFGLSKLVTAAASANVIATAGALGYRAPELVKLKKANTKSDVYSLGVVFLELLTGKSPSEALNGVDLPQRVASIVKEEWTNEVFDVELGTVIGDELLNMLKLALHCVDPSPSSRPEAEEVVRQLEEISPVPAGEDKSQLPSTSE